ncbi:MAG TPA: GNAT family N-acetyltransferase [Caulobacteraceae bacterium]|nr:GNAT family N-acetyltransferase [Caulobacteraceae bacterium]
MALVRRIRPGEAPLLPAVETDSDQTMRQTPYAYIADEPVDPPGRYQAVADAGTVWVTTDDAGAIVGFVACGGHEDGAVVYQLSVAQAAQKQGRGSALVVAAIDWARSAGYSRLMLTTFRDVPFNAPFYRRFGFRETAYADAPPSLRHMLDHEAAMGHDPQKRVGMVLPLTETDEA